MPKFYLIDVLRIIGPIPHYQTKENISPNKYFISIKTMLQNHLKLNVHKHLLATELTTDKANEDMTMMF